THLAINSFVCFISEILGLESLPQASKTEERVSWYPWTINNKYYTANVSLCVVSSPFDMNIEVARSMQAFIVYFDSKTKDSLNSVNSWLSVVEDLAPEVLILVCDHACDSGVSKQEAQQWCLAHAFELVELNPQDLPDEDDDFPESTGVKRIVQALNANVWSSVEMKDDKASSLPHEQRKVHAEKVAKAFWMAIGGDQDEIDGLSSGEES
ncbi:hypothetical protein cypCar_00032782, partial [Cyprinus carpio]